MYSDSSKLGLPMNKSSGLAAFLKALKSLPFATTLLIVAPDAASGKATTTPATTTTSAAVEVFRALATRTSVLSGSGAAAGGEAEASGGPASVADHKSRQQQQAMMDVVITKIISMLVLAVLSVLCGLLPLRMLIHSPNIFSRGRGPLEYFLCGLRLFSGGIYLATCFLHLMPDTREKMNAVMLNMGSRTTYAVPELLVISGFYAVVFVEQVIQALYVKAQQSDAGRKRRRPRPPANREEHRRRPRPARCNQDEESSHGDGDMGELVAVPNPCHSNTRSCMRHNEDDNEDDEEDDDDDVLVDDEEDMSFDNSESDDKSVDSMTQAKEKLIDPDAVHQYMRDSQQGNPAPRDSAATQVIPSGTVHVRCNSNYSPALNRQSSNNSDADTEVVLLKTFSPVSNSDTLPRRAIVPGGQYGSGPPPTIHIHSHQYRAPRPSPTMMNHCGPHPHFHRHHTNKQCHQQDKSPSSPSMPSSQIQQTEKISKEDSPHQNRLPPSPPELPPHIPASTHETELSRASHLRTADDSSLGKTTNVQYPVIDKMIESPCTENVSNINTPQENLQPVTGDVDGNRKIADLGCERDDRGIQDTFCTVSAAAPFTYTPPANTISNSCRPNKSCSSSQEDRDVDSGIFSARRDVQVPAHDRGKLATMTPSREVSFDRISDTSSQLQDIQVKRVVDELSRGDDSSRAHFRSIIYIMALSFHGIFEGMALGLQSMKSSVWALCFAIVVHRCVLAFKLGMDLCRGEEKHGTAFLCIGTFTLISVLGIIIGVLICSGASLYEDVTVPEAILQSLATGTIFYIVFFDILFKDLEGRDDLKRVSCSFVGFAMMAIVFAITRS